MNSSKLTRFGQQVKQFAAQFVQSGHATAGRRSCRWPSWRNGSERKLRSIEIANTRLLRTLMLFIEQVMAADHSCQDAVARGASHKRGRKSAKINLNTGPYCKARSVCRWGWCCVEPGCC